MGKDATEQLVQGAFALLQSKLPRAWSADLAPTAAPGDEAGGAIHIKGGSSSGTLIVEPRMSLTPRDIAQTFASPSFRRLRAGTGYHLLVVAPYLSSRARELLVQEDISYVDLTGNVRIVLDYPPMWIETEGAAKDPSSQARAVRGVRGAAAGKVIRALVDVRPPYGVTDLARAARVDGGYVTRVLGSLEGEGLVTRGPRGRVIEADWESLLRRRAAVVDLLARRSVELYVAPKDMTAMVDELGRLEERRVMISGSVAATRFAQIAVPALLVAYTVADVSFLAEHLRLLPVEDGANVAFIRAQNTAPFFNAVVSPRLVFAAPSQTAIDCLSGNGRMPAEGEAVLEWMRQNQDAWRARSLEDVKWPSWVPR